MLNRGGPLSKLVGGTIGLAKEYSADRKERKAAAQASEAHSSGNTSLQHKDDSSDYSSDEEDWVHDVDEAQQQNVSHSQDQSFDVAHIIQRLPAPSPRASSNSLSMPVLLPQRRIKSQHKGFVRAYAPVLAECEIDQRTWLDFLDGFEHSISKNGWFHVTNAGIMVAGSAAALTLGINPVLHLASMAIHASIEASRRGYLNYQQNQYLDIMNEKLFKPRGLYCMVIKYKPSSNEIMEDVDLGNNVSRSLESRDDQSKLKNLVSGSAMTVKNDIEIPTPAPLVFPGLEGTSEQQKENAFKQFGRVMGDYQDRRAAAKFEAENPDSKMPGAPRKEFASAYGDPNSAANSGGFISLATGGKMNPVGPAGERHDMRRARRDARKAKRKQRKDKMPMSKVLKSEALYLMVTNLPSQEIVDRVVANSERAHAYA